MKKVIRIVIAIIAIIIISIGWFGCNNPDEVTEKKLTVSTQNGDIESNITGSVY